jgi:hypothetical protein
MAPVAASPVVNLTSLGSDIKYLYNAAEPWAAYGAELATYALGFVPGLWWVAPGIDLAYFSIEPLVQAAVYSFADAIDLNFEQIPIDISNGLTEAGDNFVTYSLAWLNSLVPLPPLPPLPPFPGAAVQAPGEGSQLIGRSAAAAPAADAVAQAIVATETAVDETVLVPPVEVTPIVEIPAALEDSAPTRAVRRSPVTKSDTSGVRTTSDGSYTGGTPGAGASTKADRPSRGSRGAD